MKKPTYYVALLFLTLFASHCPAEDAFPLTEKRILFLGDSITAAGYYIADIETQLRIRGADAAPELINLGLPSETCCGLSEPDHPYPRPDVHERLDRALERVKPDLVVACYGMNDGIYYPFHEERFAAYQSGINKLIKKVQAAGARIVLLTPPPFDPHPLKDQPGKLLPRGAEKFAWFSIYEDYDNDVIARYAKWILTQADKVDMVVDVHTPLNEFLAKQRRSDPKFHVASDGVHMNQVGHEILASAILKAWGVETWEPATEELRKAVKQKEQILHDAWLSHVGHKRPGVKAGLPLDEATAKARALDQQIDELAAKE
jgi:lysophospholipase L1-like esterase